MRAKITPVLATWPWKRGWTSFSGFIVAEINAGLFKGFLYLEDG